MEEFEDYYELLGVSSEATTEEIKRAYLDKSFVLHPDRLAGVPESAKKRAEAELKKINVAYDTLRDGRSRSQYDIEWQRLKQKPKPVVDRPVLKFDNVKPHTPQRATFVISNLGGHYEKINISNPDSWVRVVKWDSVSAADELPLRVEIEAEADEWAKSYSESVSISLDDEETEVTVQLQTAPQPAYETVSPSSNPTSAPTPAPASAPATVSPTIKRASINSLFSWEKLLIGFMIVVCIFGVIATGVVAFTHQAPPLVGAGLFIVMSVALVLVSKETRSEKYRWRKPSFGLVFSCTIGVLLVLAFSGVPPFDGFKDSAFHAISSAYGFFVKP